MSAATTAGANFGVGLAVAEGLADGEAELVAVGDADVDGELDGVAVSPGLTGWGARSASRRALPGYPSEYQRSLPVE